MKTVEQIITAYHDFVGDKRFPCVGARAAHSKRRIHCFVASHMSCPANDANILQYIYDFVDLYRASTKPSFYTSAIIFKGPSECTEQEFDRLLWTRLNSLVTLDRANGFQHDPRVDADPGSPRFSFSLKEEAFFIIGLNPGSSRRCRQFQYPTLVFNPHAEFEALRALGRYNKMKSIVRTRDKIYSGSVNPMLGDFGERSEVHQYTGVMHGPDWICPLKYE